MSADCNWSLTMTGKNRNKYLPVILEVLYEIEHADKVQGEKIFGVFDGKNLFSKKVETSISTDNSVAQYIWGDNYLEPTEDICVLIAKAAPKASWTVSSERTSLNGGDGCTSFMEASYANGILEFKTDCYVDWRAIPQLIERMKAYTKSDDVSFAAFCNFYRVDDSINEENYSEYMNFNEETDSDMGDDYLYNSKTNTVSSTHLWVTKTITIA